MNNIKSKSTPVWGTPEYAKMLARRRARVQFKNSAQAASFIVGIAALIISSLVTFHNFTDECEAMGGDHSYVWTAKGVWKCTDDEGNMLKTYPGYAERIPWVN